MAEINWTVQATSDIDITTEFLACQSERLAKIQIQRIFNKVDHLKAFPLLGRHVPELDYKNVREILIGSYRIIYHLVSSERIDILTIHHSAIPLNIKEL